MNKLISLLLAISCLSCLSAFRTSAQSISHPWHVVDNGGGRSTSGAFTLQASIGQPAVQAMSATGTSLESGYIPGIRFISGSSSVLDLADETGWNLLSLPFILPDSGRIFQSEKFHKYGFLEVASKHLTP